MRKRMTPKMHWLSTSRTAYTITATSVCAKRRAHDAHQSRTSRASRAHALAWLYHTHTNTHTHTHTHTHMARRETDGNSMRAVDQHPRPRRDQPGDDADAHEPAVEPPGRPPFARRRRGQHAYQRDQHADGKDAAEDPKRPSRRRCDHRPCQPTQHLLPSTLSANTAPAPSCPSAVSFSPTPPLPLSPCTSEASPCPPPQTRRCRPIPSCDGAPAVRRPSLLTPLSG